MAATMTEKEEREAIQAELNKANLGELRALNEARVKKLEEEKQKKEFSKTAGERVMVYAIRDTYFLGKKAKGRKRTGAILSDGRPEFLDDPRQPHQEYPFRRHRCWVFRGDLPKLRRSEFYGIEFKEALGLADGFKYFDHTKPLEDVIDYPDGIGFMRRMAENDKNQFIKPPIGETEIRLELKGLRAGKVKPPPLTEDELEYMEQFLGIPR